MKAVVFRRFGEIEQVLKLENVRTASAIATPTLTLFSQDYPTPTAAADEVLVKVRSVSLNPIGGLTSFATLSRVFED